MRDLSVPEPAPIKNDSPSMHDLVMRDMEDRKAFGLAKYGTILQAGNGRDFLVDLYQELLDACVYVRGAIYEQDQANAANAAKVDSRCPTHEAAE